MLKAPVYLSEPPSSVSSVSFPSSSKNPNFTLTNLKPPNSSSSLSPTRTPSGVNETNQHLHATRPSHLPFRRISLPTPTSVLQRNSALSVSSFNSLPEEDDATSGTCSFPQAGVATPTGTGQAPALGGGIRHKRTSLTSNSTSLSPTDSRVEGARRRSIEGQRRHGKHKGSRSSETTGPSILPNMREAHEAKRRKIIQEFYDTEKSYVVGLDFIYHHFRSPLFSSLETADPILDRKSFTNLFSNFVDIWNLHKSFFDALTKHLSPMLQDASSSDKPQLPAASNRNLDSSPTVDSAPQEAPLPPPPLSPILLSHFPYLSLYTPFITAFPSILSTLSDLTTPPSYSNPNSHFSKSFADFLAEQESDPKCGKLKFRDWILTIVQRCPRYLLLLKDLRGCMDPVGDGQDREYEKLGKVLDLVAKITNSLNTSLQTHAQTLSLISLQRSTSNLPFALVVPGRTLLKRGPLYQIERSEPAREREFLLFSDCLIWFVRSGEETEWGWRRMFSGGKTDPSSSSDAEEFDLPNPIYRFGNRLRSMSDANLPLPPIIRRGGAAGDATKSTPSSPQKGRFPRPASGAQPPPMPAPLAKRHSTASSFGSGSGSGSGMDEKWVYKGRAELVNLEVVVTSELAGEQTRFEVLSPEGSFALYATTKHDRDEWVYALRQAKAQILASLNMTNPNSTLTSSASTNHVRRSLQALPFPPEEYRLDTIREGRMTKQNGERRGKVDHWVPAIWIPDEKTKECMRCGQPFGWRRRRHHCRLCGRCVCATCSDKTFYIADLSVKDGSSNPARSCNICYETVFPVLEDVPPSEGDIDFGQNASDDSRMSSAMKKEMEREDSNDGNAKDTITSLSNFSAWLAMPPRRDSAVDTTPQALMGIEFERGVEGMLSRTPSEHGLGEGRRSRVRQKSQNSRPISYMQVLEGFVDGSGSSIVVDSAHGDDHVRLLDSPSTPTSQVLNEPPPKESTVRKKKRFSLPALAMQPLNVTARTILANGADGSSASPTSVRDPRSGKNTAAKVSKRFSLMLSSGRNRSTTSINVGAYDEVGELKDKVEGSHDVDGQQGGHVCEKSLVMSKLNDLLKGSRAKS